MGGMRPNVLGRGMALFGDQTTTGAKLIPSLSCGNILGRRPIVLGDKTTACPNNSPAPCSRGQGSRFMWLPLWL